MKVRFYETPTQRHALHALASLGEKASMHPDIRTVAAQLTNECDPRDDKCEIAAIFNAVKYGDERIKGLSNGVRYLADPRWADAFMHPARLLKQCRKGACAGDCDDHACLLMALLGSIGFKVGLRAWGPNGSNGDYTHVYAMVGFPKRDPQQIITLDTTVPESEVGWEPPEGEVLNAWAE